MANWRGARRFGIGFGPGLGRGGGVNHVLVSYSGWVSSGVRGGREEGGDFVRDFDDSDLKQVIAWHN